MPESARHCLVLLGLAASAVTKLAPFGSFTWLARGYGHDVALCVVAYMLLRPSFHGPGPTALTTLSIVYLSEVLQLLIPEPAGLHLPLLGTFDWWDFVAFTLGTALAFGLDRALAGRTAAGAEEPVS